MWEIINLFKIAAKSLLKRNRGNILFLVCIIILLMIPTLQFNVTQSVMNHVASSQRKDFRQLYRYLLWLWKIGHNWSWFFRKRFIGNTPFEIEGSKYTISGIIQDFGYLWPQSEVQINNNAGAINALVSEQEAGRILRQTSRMTRQILIVQQLGVSNPIENDSNLLRNTNNS